MRWLEYRDLPKPGKGSALLNRFTALCPVHDCVNAGNDQTWWDGGKWYNLKKKNQPSHLKLEMVPFCYIPDGKNFQVIKMAFQNTSTGDTFPIRSWHQPNFITKDISDESDKDIKDLHTVKLLCWDAAQKQSRNILRAGLCQVWYFSLKARIMALYSTIYYDVTATLSQASGFVRDAFLTCKASAIGR